MKNFFKVLSSFYLGVFVFVAIDKKIHLPEPPKLYTNLDVFVVTIGFIWIWALGYLTHKENQDNK
jgi:hypothetical protein